MLPAPASSPPSTAQANMAPTEMPSAPPNPTLSLPMSLPTRPSLPVSPSDPVPHPKRRTMVLLCSLCICLNYADRVNMSVTIIPLATSLHLSLRQQSAVLSSFFVGYIPMQLGGALLARRLGGKRVLGAGAALWSLFTVLTPAAAAAGLPMLLACRAAMGMAEGVAFPGIFHFLAGWLPKAERATSTARFLAGMHVGTVLALLVSPVVIARVSWHAVFYLFGAAGALWVAAWLRLAEDCDAAAVTVVEDHVSARPPAEAGGEAAAGAAILRLGARVGVADRERVEANTGHALPLELSPPDGLSGVQPTSEAQHGADAVRPSAALRTELLLVREILTDRRALSVCVTQSIFGLIHYTLLAWLPTYFKSVYHIDIQALALTAAPYAVMALSTPLGGVLSDRLARRKKHGKPCGVTRARKIVTALSGSGAAISLLLFTRAPSMASAVGWMSSALAFMAWNSGGVYTAFLDLSVPRATGMFKGVANTMTSMAGFSAAPLAAALLDTLGGDWRRTFAMLTICFVPMTLVFCVGFSTDGRLIGNRGTGIAAEETQNV